MRSSVIVPIYQSPAVLSLFLESLEQTVEPDTQLILINDGSGPEAGELIEESARAVKAERAGAFTVETVHNTNPRGCGQALNQGLSLAEGDHVFFVDSDLILTSGWQSGMLRTLRDHPRAGMTAGVLLYPHTGGVQHSGITFGETLGRHLYLNGRPDDLPGTPYTVQAAAFALFAMTRQVRDDVGLLDERYFNGYEDFDYQMRARLLGYRTVIDPRVTSYHWEQRNGVHRAGNRKSNLARFWKTWGKHVENDMTSRILDALSGTADLGRFVPLDLAETRTDAAGVWQALADATSLDRHDVLDYSTKVDGTQPILLPHVLPTALLTEPRPLLILVENFVRLLDNRMWLAQRLQTRSEDVVIDLHGNRTGLEDLFAGCWPGGKVR
ncbi:glycosyltransferase family 2 protein [Streptomyces sp. SP18CS02]|uniref:glycosyltransferase family 2 protein n=1 Tax=Streptomyces sp. SP18CS02 TaxID=3002531 RepID=UPI002E771E96|nr:glycosyltransferase [Streptomyces sp. SP18CS02]MEE1754453.1 glycosyltransferase [Streptomyces sp. SP18CS02]